MTKIHDTSNRRGRPYIDGVRKSEKMEFRMGAADKSIIQSVALDALGTPTSFWREWLVASSKILHDAQDGTIPPDELPGLLGDELTKLAMEANVITVGEDINVMDNANIKMDIKTMEDDED